MIFPVMRILLALLFLPALAFAGSVPERFGDGCLPVCETGCLKPFAIPDRWDDVTAVAGHDDWRNNGRYDAERLTGDVNGNTIYDPGDGYDDANGNGQYDGEGYNPLLTGYIPDPYPGNWLAPNGDYGLQLVLKAGAPGQATTNQAFAIDLPVINRGTPQTGASAYRAALENCLHQEAWPGDWLQVETGNMSGPTIAGVLAIIAKDPAARFDPATKTIVGSNAPDGFSPRLIIVPLTDPRIRVKSGRMQLQANKLTAFFLEEVDDQGTVRGRFLKVRNLGRPCTCCGDIRANWLMNCP
jgi:hypothetical protein